jgi:hypothetical protein
VLREWCGFVRCRNNLSATATRDLTSNPQFAAGKARQLCILRATGANTIKLAAGSGLQLDTGTSFCATQSTGVRSAGGDVKTYRCRGTTPRHRHTDG